MSFDQLDLFVLSTAENEWKLNLEDADTTVRVVWFGPGPIRMYQITARLPGPTVAFDVVVPEDRPLLVYSVRYRETPVSYTTPGTITLLDVGRYRVTVGGQSVAVKPRPDYPDAGFGRAGVPRRLGGARRRSGTPPELAGGSRHPGR